jgi:Zn-dependent peptidase ImmA (M78 family)
MISAEEARRFAEAHFPEAPEKLAAHLGLTVHESKLSGCDGWCLVADNRAIIRINSNQSSGRKRFTLSHELGHLILGIPSIVGETYEQMLSSDSAEERRVNELASELLLPASVVQLALQKRIVVAGDLQKLAKRANVSVLAAAIRVCNLATEIGLMSATVVLFEGDDVQWQWSRTGHIPEQSAHSLLTAARQASPKAYRQMQPDGTAIVASIIENPHLGSATVFVQRIPAELGLSLSHHERRQQLEELLFRGDTKLLQQVSGLLGAHKNRILTAKPSRDAAIADFWQRNAARLSATTLNSEIGRDYVALRIADWYSR